MTPVETVKCMYEAFGRGDIPAILAHLSPDIEWEYGPPTDGVPWLQPRRGPAEVAGFFQALGAIEFRRFEVKRVFGDGDLVVGMVDLDGLHRETGKRIVEVDEVHLWHFDALGRIGRFRHRCDTLQHWRAVSGKGAIAATASAAPAAA